MIVERWRPAVGHDGYEVSDLGGVRGVDRYVPSRGGHRRLQRGRVLTPWPRNAYGHLAVDLGGRRRYVHQLVAETWIGPCPDGQQVRHKDDNPTNNAARNLHYGTPSDNRYDSVRNGGHHRASAERCKYRHLLRAPNLRNPRKQKPAHHRQCLACHRAHAYCTRHGCMEDMQAVSNRYYRELIPNDPATSGAPA